MVTLQKINLFVDKLAASVSTRKYNSILAAFLVRYRRDPVDDPYHGKWVQI